MLCGLCIAEIIEAKIKTVMGYRGFIAASAHHPVAAQGFRQNFVYKGRRITLPLQI
jgi:hypothetical protein